MLKQAFERVRNNPLLKDNLILFIGVFFLGVSGFVYHFIVGRLLGPAEYGNLGVLLSIIYIFLIALNTIQMSIAKFTADFTVNKKEGKIKYLFQRSCRDFIIAALFFVVFALFMNNVVADYLHLRKSSLIVLAIGIFCIFLVPIVRGILQGRGQFTALSINNGVEGITKLIVGPMLVIFGLSTEGATAAILLAMGVAFIFGLIPLRQVIKKQKEVFQVRNVYKYGLVLGLMLTSLTLFYTIDVIIVKHFFDEVQAGYYAALAILGKVLFFGSSSIGQVMFPKVAALHAEKKPHKHLFYKSALLVLLFIFPVLFVYFTFPNLVVGILFGEKFLEVVPLLGLFGLYMAIFCFIYLFSYYFISLKSSWQFVALLFFFNILEAYLLYNFHETLSQVITVLISLSLLMLMVLYGIFTRIRDA
ncbi:MAG TPA: oligosaccharide flippase family protein [Candidatus Nanoarchaeia archaeon]|nr:oligosaccharide flippase family protein [Candidatus Nanoarchaeia archaeon]